MLYRISRLITILFISLAAMLILPNLYKKLFSESFEYQNVSYSELLNDFIYTRSVSSTDNKSGAGYLYEDTKGNAYTLSEVDSLMPLERVSQLVMEKRFPDSICGVPVTAKDVSDASYFIYLSGRGQVYYGLFDLCDKKLSISRKWATNDLFRINERGIEFINAKTNEIEVEVSKRFNDELLKLDFVFPASMIWNTNNKDQREQIGYIVADSDKKLFVLSMDQGNPSIQTLSLPNDEYVEMVNFSDKAEFVAFVTTVNGSLYLLNNDFVYQYVPVGNIQGKSVMFRHNYLFNTFTISDKDSTSYNILDKDFMPVNSLDVLSKKSKNPEYTTVANCIFPVRIWQTPWNGFSIHIGNLSSVFLVNILMVVLMLLLKKMLGRPLFSNPNSIIDILVVFFLGIFGLIGVLLIYDSAQRTIKNNDGKI